MKKLVLLFAAIFVLSITGCKDNNDETTYSIVGNWQPIKRVATTVTNNTPITETYDYTDCQKTSRWIFNEDTSGKQVTNDLVGTVCSLISTKNFTYVYDKDTKKIQLSFQGVVQSGRVTSLTATTMNIILETNDGTTYYSDTYSFVRQ